MENSGPDIDNLTSLLDNWKGLVPELELTPEEVLDVNFSNITLDGKVILDRKIRLGAVHLVLQKAWWHVV